MVNGTSRVLITVKVTPKKNLIVKDNLGKKVVLVESMVNFLKVQSSKGVSDALIFRVQTR